jgi:hypothetical protein
MSQLDDANNIWGGVNIISLFITQFYQPSVFSPLLGTLFTPAPFQLTFFS